MKERIITGLQDKSSVFYRMLNGFLFAVIVWPILTWAQFYFKTTEDYFVYKSIESTKMVYKEDDPLEFISTISRKQVTDMRYNDTLFCGFFNDSLFWYSQTLQDYNNAPKGEFKSRWVYQGERPTAPMICQLHSAPYVKLPFGIDTDPQVIVTKKFYLE